MELERFEFASFALLILLGCMSPGPDWIVVVKHSLVSRRSGVLSAIGVAAGITAHMTYCLVGIGLLIQNSPTAYLMIRTIGGGYLCFMGIRGVSASVTCDPEQQSSVPEVTPWMAFRDGLITNLFNPKATVFFLGLVSVMIEPGEPVWIQLLYGATAVTVTCAWFTLLALLFSAGMLGQRLVTLQPYIQRLFGGALIALGAYIIFGG